MALTSNLSVCLKNALTLVGAFFIIALAPVTSHASCADYFASSSSFNEQIYRSSLGRAALPAFGALPEEVLAFATPVDLYDVLHKELEIDQIRFGSKMKVYGGLIGRRTLVIRPPAFQSVDSREKYLVELAHVLFIEKQKHLRFATPQRYIAELKTFSAKLEKVVSVSNNRFNYFTYALRSFFGIAPRNGLWPAQGGRLGFHYTLSRTFAAFYIIVAGQAMLEIPKAVETFQTLAAVQTEVVELVQNMPTIEFDPVSERQLLLESYQARLEALELEILEADPADLQGMKDRAERFKAIIGAIEDELAEYKS